MATAGAGSELKALKSSRTSHLGKVSKIHNELTKLIEKPDQAAKMMELKGRFDIAIARCLEACKKYLDALPIEDNKGRLDSNQKIKTTQQLQIETNHLYEGYRERYAEPVENPTTRPSSDKVTTQHGYTQEVPRASTVPTSPTPAAITSGLQRTTLSDPAVKAKSRNSGRSQRSTSTTASAKARAKAKLLQLKAQQAAREAGLVLQLKQKEFESAVAVEKLNVQLKLNQAFAAAEVAEMEADALTLEGSSIGSVQDTEEAESMRNSAVQRLLSSTDLAAPNPAEGCFGAQSTITNPNPFPNSDVTLYQPTSDREGILFPPPSFQPHVQFTTTGSTNEQVPVPESTSRQSTSTHPEVFQNNSQQDLINVVTAMSASIRQGFSLPKREMPTFNGDPLQYFEFLKNFNVHIEQCIPDAATQLGYLIDLCTGKAKEAIRSCSAISSPEVGLERAKRTLHKKFGQKFIVVEAHTKHLCEGPNIRAGDFQGLSKLSNEMRNCEIILGEWDCRSQLDSNDTILKIFKRLPRPLQANVRDEMYRINQSGRRFTFIDLSRLVEKFEERDSTFLGKAYNEFNKSQRQYNLQRTRPPAKNVSSFLVKETGQQSAPPGCLECGSQDHYLWKCEVFKQRAVEDRVSIVRQNKLCYNCLMPSHFLKDCKNKNKCKVCNKKHHTLVHRYSQPQQQPVEDQEETEHSPSSSSGSGENNVCSTTIKEQLGTIRLKVLPVRVKSAIGNKWVETYAFLDEGSTGSFCTQALTNRLNIQGKYEDCEMSTLSGRHVESGYKVDLVVQGINNQHKLNLPYVMAIKSLPDLKYTIPNSTDVMRHSHLQGIVFPNLKTSQNIEILIGADCLPAHEIIEVRRGKPGQPNAIHTTLGWTLMGPDGGSNISVNNHLINFIKEDNKQIHEQLQLLYNHDFNLPGDSTHNLSPSIEDKRGLNIMTSSCTLVNGHIQLALPWRVDDTILHNNRESALRRLKSLKKRLQKDSTIFKKYKDKIEEYINLGQAVKLPSDSSTSPRTWYIPHHYVGPKFRIVFDCSAIDNKNGKSLNDYLLQGPDQTNRLLDVLLKFRQEECAVVADIKGMFHQVLVDPRDKDAFRFLWFEDDINSNIVDHRMEVHVFGATSSPSCAAFALKQATKLSSCNQVTTSTILNNFYVDDLLVSCSSPKEMVQLIIDLRRALEHAGFHLTKFITNNSEVRTSIPESELAPIEKINMEENAPNKTLGIWWNSVTDEFELHVNTTTKDFTRRGILSVISQLFDPFGWLQPVILPMKKLMQTLCCEKLGWDDQIPEVYHSTWDNWLNELSQLESIRISRCFKPQNNSNFTNLQLHCFCDASQLIGYGAVCYFRWQLKDTATTTFVLGKARVNPLKFTSVPRLELCSAVVGARLANIITTACDYKINKVIFWTDSHSVLAYINNISSRFQTFIANRISIIHDLTNPQQWHYIPTQHNPADIASRGISPQQLTSSNWFSGPKFLCHPEKDWPNASFSENDMDDLEWRVQKIISTTLSTSISQHNSSGGLQLLIQRYSSLIRLKKAFAWLTRFKKWIQSKKLIINKARLTITELNMAEDDIIRLVQREGFPADVFKLFNSQSRRIPSRSTTLAKFTRLTPFMEKGIVRVGGRLQRSSLDYDTRHPIILPASHHFTSLVIQHYHKSEGHSGTVHVLAATRERYWIMKGHRVIRETLRKCLPCRMIEAKVGEQIMSPLPAARVNRPSRPFSSVGVDFMGPLLVKVNRSEVKRYGSIFTCMATRAVHIEVAASLTTDSFLNAFNRFISRRGKPERVFCDNGLNFVGAEKVLQKAIQNWNQQHIDNSLQQLGIQWQFNPPAASHQGGVWERVIRSVRKILKAITHEQTLTDDALSTLLCEAERILNNRPIAPLSDNPRDLATLTPNSILIGTLEENLPWDIFLAADGYRKTWRKVQWAADNFWRRWSSEYLTTLQQRQKWLTPTRNVQVGELVLLLDENLKTPRGCWRKAIIETVYPDKDGFVRRVKLRTSTSSYTRDIRKICVLEAN